MHMERRFKMCRNANMSKSYLVILSTACLKITPVINKFNGLWKKSLIGLSGADERPSAAQLSVCCLSLYLSCEINS